jgi:acetylornithine deacetylase/succinyl-diaminopimelate desuccinylase-like protein
VVLLCAITKSQSNMEISELKEEFARNREAIISRWMDFLRIPSISAQPAHDKDCLNAANWLDSYLSSMGFAVELLGGTNRPVVFAQRMIPNRPTVLFYGHYDVQPEDPVELWDSPPFEPQIRGDRLYARGANDDKGHVMFVLAALEALIKNNQLNYSVKILIEGEEETGGKVIAAGLASWRDKVKADSVLVCDTMWVAPQLPTIVLGLKGIVACTVELSGLTKDLHSGLAGGLVKNPATELARLVATLHRPSGEIAIQGYYDEVVPIPADAREVMRNTPIDLRVVEQAVGVSLTGGEADKFTPLERLGFRPTVEVNGINSGYSGPGTKTIVPSKALLKLSCRLVPNQNPEKCMKLLQDHLQKYAPPEFKIEFSDIEIAGAAFSLSPSQPAISRASKTLAEVTGKPVIHSWQGGSIPIVPQLQQVSGGVPILAGFGLEQDNLHAPNESFSLTQFEYGFLFVGRLLST